jgi:hypothetical protein
MLWHGVMDPREVAASPCPSNCKPPTRTTTSRLPPCAAPRWEPPCPTADRAGSRYRHLHKPRIHATFRSRTRSRISPCTPSARKPSVRILANAGAVGQALSCCWGIHGRCLKPARTRGFFTLACAHSMGTFPILFLFSTRGW